MDDRKIERTLAVKADRLGLVKKDRSCFFQRITPAFARKYPRYRQFIGLFLVTETTDHLGQRCVVIEWMVYQEQRYHNTGKAA